MEKEIYYIGAHTSASGGVHHALLEGVEIGATTIQLFTSNQRQWQAKTLEASLVEKWKTTLKESGLKHIMSHDSYLINLGSPKEEVLLKSRHAFAQEIERCQTLGISYLNFHPGACLESDEEECLDTIVASLRLYAPLLEKSTLRLLIETTAGQGSTVGYRFEHLAYIIQKVKNDLPIGVCIDTCHIFAAGYDIRTNAAWDKTLAEFEKIVGLDQLYAFHLNDSLKGLGSRVDRHQALGEGQIGWESFRFLMRDPRTRHLPKYLETPGGCPLWKREIEQLRGFTQI